MGILKAFGVENAEVIESSIVTEEEKKVVVKQLRFTSQILYLDTVFQHKNDGSSCHEFKAVWTNMLLLNIQEPEEAHQQPTGSSVYSSIIRLI